MAQHEARARKREAQAQDVSREPTSPAAVMRALEQAAGDPAALQEVLQGGVRSGVVTPEDVARIEALLQGTAGGRAIAFDASPQLSPLRDLGAVRLSEDLPLVFAAGGADAAAVGEMVVARPGAIDERAQIGVDLLVHELTHVRQHRSMGPAIHFDAGTTPEDHAAGRTEQQELDAIRAAHGAEIARVIACLRGHTSDGDVHNVLNIFSHWPAETITRAWTLVGRGWLDDLLDNLEPEHFQAHPREMIATCQALPPGERISRILDMAGGGFWTRVSEDEALMILYMVQGLPRQALERFQAHDDGDSYRAWRRALPSGAQATLQGGVDAGREEQLRQQEGARRREADEEQQVQAAVSGPVDRIARQLRTAWDDWAVTDSDATQVFDILKGYANDPAQLRAIVRALEGHRDGDLMQRWVDNLPDQIAYAEGNVGPFLRILQARPPEMAIQHAMRLLDYGLFDWAVTDSEAVLAYHLIRGLPATAQHSFRMRDGNRWFLRMEDNLRQEVMRGEEHDFHEGGYGLVDGEPGRGSTEDQERERAEDQQTIQATRSEIDQLAERIRHADLSGAAGALTTLYTAGGGEGGAVCRAWTRDLDRQGLIDELLDKLQASKWGQERRGMTLRILRLRDPVRNMALMRDLLSYGIVDWEINSTEARLAFECIRALPTGMRAELIALEPGWYQRMDENVSQELRESREFGMYDGEESGDTTHLLGQLLDPAIWEPASDSADPLGRLRMVLHMIAQAGLMHEAHPSIAAHWSDSAAHGELFAQMGYGPDGVLDESVVDQTDSNTMTTIFQGLDALGRAEGGEGGTVGYALGVQDSMNLRGLEMDELQQAFGGHINGVRFGGAEETEDEEGRQDVGELDVQIDEERGLVRVEAASLPVESVNMLVGTMTLRAGASSVEGALLEAKYATDVDPDTRLHIHLSSMVIHDLMLVFEDRMIGIGCLTLQGFDLAGQRDGAPQVQSGDSAFEDAMKGIGRVFELIGKIGTLGFFFGDWTRDFGALVDHLKSAFAEDFNLQLQLGSIAVTNVVDSRGGHVGGASIEGVDISIALDREADLRRRIAQSREQAGANPTADQQATIAAMEEQLQVWQAREARLAELQGRAGHEALSDEEQAELDELTTALRTVGVEGSITGGLHVRDANMMGVSAESLDVTGISVSGELPGARGMVDAQLTDRGALESDARLTGATEPGLSQTASLDVRAESVTGSQLAYRSTQLRHEALAEQIAALHARDPLNEGDRSRLEALERELTSLRPHVARLDELRGRFGSLTDGERAEYQQLLTLLRQDESFHVDSLDLHGATIGVDMQNHGATFSAESGTLTGVRAGGMEVDRVEGTGLGVGYSGADGGQLTVDATTATLTGVDQVGRIDRLRARLGELEAITERSPAHEGEIQSVRDQIAMFERVQAEVAELRPLAEAGLAKPEAERTQEDWDHIHALARREQELGAWQGGAHADTIGIEDAHLSVTGLGDAFADGWEMPTGGLSVQGSREGEPMVGRVHVTGARQGDNEVADIDLHALGGQLDQVDEDHIRLTELSVGSLVVSGAHVGSGTTHIDVDGSVTLEGATVTADAYWGTREEHGARIRELQRVSVSHLHFNRLSGADLHLRTATMEVDLVEGSLGGIDLVGLEYDAAAGATTFRNLSMDRTSMTGLAARLGEDTTARVGNLTSGRVDVSSVTSGTYTVSVADLAGGDIELDRPGLGMTVRRLEDTDIAGLTYDGATGAIAFPDIHIQAIDFSRVTYDGPPKHLAISERLEGHDITVRGTYQPEPFQVDITELVIHQAELVGVHYQDTSRGWDINVRRGSAGAVRMAGFRMTEDSLVMDTDVDGLSLAGLDAAIGASLHATGGLTMGHLGIAFLEDGRGQYDIDHMATDDLALRLGDPTGDVTMVNLGGSRDLNADIEMDGDTTRLRNVDLTQLHLGSLDWRSGDKRVQSGDGVDVFDARFDATLTTVHQPDGTTATAIQVDGLHVGGVMADELLYTQGDRRVSIDHRDESSGVTIVNIDAEQIRMGADGAITSTQIDVGSVVGNDVAVQVGSTLSAHADFDASTLHVTFQEGGRIVTRIEDLSATVTGTASGTDFSVEVQHVDTGDVTVSDTEVTIPNLSIPTLRLHSLGFDSPTMAVSLLPGGMAEMTGTTANMTIHRRPASEGGGLDSVVVHRLDVPAVTVGGLEVELKDRGIVVTLPANRTATIDGMWLDEYTIAAPLLEGGPWTTSGEAGIEAFDVAGLRVAMEGTELWTDVSTGAIGLSQLDDGTSDINLNDLTLQNMHGTVDGSSFAVRSIVVDTVAVTNDELGTHIDSGNTVISGIVYDDGNIRIEILTATLPEGVDLPTLDQVDIEDLQIQQADITIRDVGALSSEDSDEESAVTSWDFLDHVSGHLNFHVFMTYHLDHVFSVTNFESDVTIPITNGEVDMAAVDRSLGGVEGWALDFETTGDLAYIEADYVLGSTRLLQWHLRSDQERERARGRGQNGRMVRSGHTDEVYEVPATRFDLAHVRLASMVDQTDVMPSNSGEPAPEPVPGQEQEDSAFELWNLVVSNIDGRFDMPTASSIPLRSGGVIRLGDETHPGIAGLTVGGSLSYYGLGENPRQTPRRLNLGLEQLNASVEGVEVAGNLLDIGQLHIGQLENASLTFNGFSPRRFFARITEARARNIRVLRPGD